MNWKLDIYASLCYLLYWKDFLQLTYHSSARSLDSAPFAECTEERENYYTYQFFVFLFRSVHVLIYFFVINLEYISESISSTEVVCLDAEFNFIYLFYASYNIPRLRAEAGQGWALLISRKTP